MVSVLRLTMLGSACARVLEYTTLIGNFSDFGGGLYSVAVDEQHGEVFLTSSLGSPVTAANILKVDPETLAIQADLEPEQFGNVLGVYGAALDEKSNRLWTTNSVQNTVSFFNTENLDDFTVFPEGSLKAARDIVVDPETGLAYASSSKLDIISVFAANHTEGPLKTFNLTELSGEPFRRVMSLAFHDNVLFTASYKDNKALALNLTNATAQVFDLSCANGSTGVAVDTQRQRLYVASQLSNTTSIVDIRSGGVLKTVPVPGGPLSAAYDGHNDLVYVACRTGDALAVIDASTSKLVATIEVPKPSYVTVDSQSNVYVTDKSLGDGGLYKFIPTQNGVFAPGLNGTNSTNSTNASSAHSSYSGVLATAVLDEKAASTTSSNAGNTIVVSVVSAVIAAIAALVL